MIYTSYYANKDALKAGLKRVSISRYVPDWAQVDEVDQSLAPSEELLRAYKDGKIDEAGYTSIYMDGLKSLSPEKIALKYENCVLLCYEKTGEFCHRNLLRAWLSKNNIRSIEFGDGLIKPKEKSLKVSKEKWFSVELASANKDKIFVFGDNLEGYGEKGQAIIRKCGNAFGIPTKRKPSMEEGSFFSDQEDEVQIVKEKLRELYKLMQEGFEIVFPQDGIGTGLAEMDKRSPLAFKEMMDIIENHFFIHIKGQQSLFD